MDSIHIQPATVTETKTVTSFSIRVTSLELFRSVSVMVDLRDASGNFAGVRNFVISGAEYAGWNNDDQYLVALVAQKLGFTLTA